MCLILVHTLKTHFERRIKECAANLTLRLPVANCSKILLQSLNVINNILYRGKYKLQVQNSFYSLIFPCVCMYVSVLGYMT